MKIKATTTASLLLLSLSTGVAFAQASLEDRVSKLESGRSADQAEVDTLKQGFVELVKGLSEQLPKEFDAKADKADLDEVKNVVADNYETINNHESVLTDHADRIVDLQDHKADKAVVDAHTNAINELAEKHDEAGKELGRFVGHVNDSFVKVGEHLNTLNDEKADKTEVADLKDKTLLAFQELTKTVDEQKADKSVVDDLIEKHNEAGKQITAFVEHVNDGFEKVGEHLNTLADEKADKTALDAKADKTEVTDLKSKTLQAFQEMTQAVSADLETKADKTELDKKADKVSVDAVKKQVANVAVTTYRLDRDIQQTQEAVAGNAATLANHADAIIDLSQNKADKAEFDNFKEETITNVEKVGTIALGAEASINDLLDALYGKEGTEESGQLGKMYDEINNKADKGVVDDLIEKHNEAGKQITAFVEHVNGGFEKVGEHLNTLNDEKADKTEVADLKDKTLEAFQELTKTVDEQKADKADLDEVKEVVADNYAAIDNHSAVLNDHADRIEDLQEHKADKAVVDAHTNAINELAEKHDEAGKQLERFVEDVNDSFGIVSTNLNTLNTEKADKSELAGKADVAALAEKADKSVVEQLGLDLTLKASKEEVIALDEKKADKSELAHKADKEDVVALDEKKADKSEVRRIGVQVDANTNGINKLEQTKLDKAEFAVLNTEFKSLNTEFKSLKSTVGQLSSQVDANTARLNQLDGRIAGVQKEVRRGLASQAALSGLFQPYNVGKVNVTAAVGGYKSNTALAVGAGYRFNEKVAAKAGLAVSTSGGGVSYNVGVNYEF